MTNLDPLKIPIEIDGLRQAMSSLNDLEARIEKLEKKQEQANKKSVDDAKKTGEKKKESAKKIDEEIVDSAKKTTTKLKEEDEKRAENAIREAKRSSNYIDALYRRMGSRYGLGIGRGLIQGAMAPINMATMLGTVGASALVGSALSHQMSLEKAAAALEVSSSGLKGQKPISSSLSMSMGKEIGNETYTDPTDVIGAMHKMVERSGRPDVASNMIREVMRLSKAEGIDPAALATTVGMAIKENPSLDTKQMIMLLRTLVQQGKEGSVELSEMVTALPRAISTSSSIEGDQGTQQVRIASLIQLAIPAAGSVDEAVTSVERAVSDLRKHDKHFTALTGQSVMSKAEPGKLRDTQELLISAITKSGGDIKKLGTIFEERSIRLIEALLPTYHNAEKNKKGSGAEALRSQMDEMNVARLTEKQEQKDLDKKKALASEQLEQAFRDLKQQVGEKLIPILPPLIDTFKDMIPTLVSLMSTVGDIAKWATANPFEAIVAGLGLSITKSIMGQIAETGIRLAFREVGVAALGQVGNITALGAASTLAAGGAEGGLLGLGAAATAAIGTTAAVGLVGLLFAASAAAVAWNIYKSQKEEEERKQLGSKEAKDEAGKNKKNYEELKEAEEHLKEVAGRKKDNSLDYESAQKAVEEAIKKFESNLSPEVVDKLIPLRSHVGDSAYPNKEAEEEYDRIASSQFGKITNKRLSELRGELGDEQDKLTSLYGQDKLTSLAPHDLTTTQFNQEAIDEEEKKIAILTQKIEELNMPKVSDIKIGNIDETSIRLGKGIYDFVESKGGLPVASPGPNIGPTIGFTP